MPTKVVLISGKQGSGKTSLSASLKRLLEDAGLFVHSRKFADPLYDMHEQCLDVLRAYGIDRGKKDGKLLQLLGTEYGRSIDENIWVKCAQHAIDDIQVAGCEVVIIDDCRFKNELSAFPDALKIRLECTKDQRKLRCDSWRENEMHPSEIDLDEWVLEPGRFDMIINTGTRALETYADHIAEYVRRCLSLST